MGNARIVYATKTRHSKKLAEAIGKELNARAENAADRPAAAEAELLFVVGGLYGGQSLPELVEFVKSLDSRKIKRAALVTSSATRKQGADAGERASSGKGN